MVTEYPGSELLASREWFLEKYWLPIEHPLKDAARTLILSSDYVCRHIKLLVGLLHVDSEVYLLERDAYFKQVAAIPLTSSLELFMTALRHFRHEHFLRLLLLQTSAAASTEQVLCSWSDCADALILHVIAYCNQTLSERFGVPLNTNGDVSEFYTLAMGKLGGMELNFSSDIDLIFVYAEGGETDGNEVLTNEHYYSKLIQQFVNIMQTVTADGFVFRVDLRLRPNGESGSLSLSFAGMETYYQEQGRDWERYAMVKARVITEDLSVQPQWFARLIIPFVYRRYVDFSVIEALRSMKAMIEREVQLNPRLNDLKRGHGGIREVEFIIQTMQLIRGGRIPALQTQNAIEALMVIKKEHLSNRCEALKQAYLFLRRLENVIQSQNDQQLHELPTQEIKKEQVCLAMDFASWEALIDQLAQYQRIISHSFAKVLARADDYEDNERLLANQLLSLWQGHVEEGMAVNLLAGLGFGEPEHSYMVIHTLRHSSRCRRLTQASRMRLDRFMVVLLSELSRSLKPDEVLLQMMQLLEQMVGRSAYLALLAENPGALQELMHYMEHSPFITSLLVNQPFLLELLIDDDKQWRPTLLRDLSIQLSDQLASNEDIEFKEECLRQFKLTHWFLAARAELYGQVHGVRVSEFLADLAEVILTEVLNLAFLQLKERYPQIETLKSRFTVIAYGTFGSREMNFGSDLDLVFLHTAEPSEESLVTRLTQKILNSMTVRTQSGVLYSVDTRLRPSGSAGLLVSHLNAFAGYQQHQAWTWEHQALIKARIVYGTQTIKSYFQRFKKSIFEHTRDAVLLQEDVLAMRARIDTHLEQDPIRHVAGGLLDLEFLIQYLILRMGKALRSKSTQLLEQVKGLAQEGVLSAEQAKVLSDAYSVYQDVLHWRIIQPEKVIEPSAVEYLQRQVMAICNVIYSANSAYKS